MDIQRLAGRLAAVNRFLAKSAKHNLPFFKMLRGSEPFTWTTEALKAHLSSLQTLVIPLAGEGLLLYASASVTTMSGILVWEEEKEVRYIQRIVYYISKALDDAKTHYTQLEKVAHALLVASHKL